jgi:hypothetical protein
VSVPRFDIGDLVRVIGSDDREYLDGKVIGYDDADRDGGSDYEVLVLWDCHNSCDYWMASRLEKLPNP